MRIAINGFGRIGRQVLRIGIDHPELEFVAVNDLTDAPTLAHLFKHDSVHGAFKGTVKTVDNGFEINGKTVRVLAEKDPANLPWKDLGVDLVIESTGRFTEADKARVHLQAGAKKVIISAPAKHEDLTIAMGVNEQQYDPERHHILSNASCTTNCLAPVAKVLHENFGISRGLMTTAHAYTNDQRILDLPHSDLRRARAAAVSIIPTTTGAAKAVSLVIPELKGKLNGFALRVPVVDVSVVDLVVELNRDVTVEEINQALKEAAAKMYKGKVLMVSDEPLVSTDYIGSPFSSIVDSQLTMVMDKRMAKVIAWYDNEWGYSNRLVDLAEYMAQRLK